MFCIIVMVGLALDLGLGLHFVALDLTSALRRPFWTLVKDKKGSIRDCCLQLNSFLRLPLPHMYVAISHRQF